MDDKKAYGGIVYKQILINAILQIGKRRKKTELTGISPLRGRGSALDCSSIEEEEEEEEEEEDYYYCLCLVFTIMLSPYILKRRPSYSVVCNLCDKQTIAYL